MNNNAMDMDFKYIMQDVTHVYIGARYTYRELIEAEDVPFKIKKMINQYIEPELHGEDLSIESHFYYMDGSGFAYQTFLQLKTQVRISIIKGNKYHTMTMKLQDFVKIPPEEKEKDGIKIQEIIIAKLALMTL